MASTPLLLVNNLSAIETAWLANYSGTEQYTCWPLREWNNTNLFIASYLCTSAGNQGFLQKRKSWSHSSAPKLSLICTLKLIGVWRKCSQVTCRTFSFFFETKRLGLSEVQFHVVGSLSFTVIYATYCSLFPFT